MRFRANIEKSGSCLAINKHFLCNIISYHFSHTFVSQLLYVRITIVKRKEDLCDTKK